MDPELAERLARHGRWLDEHTEPLPFDDAVDDERVDIAPVAGGTDGWPRRARWAVAAVAAAALVAGMTVAVRRADGPVTGGSTTTATTAPAAAGALATALASLGIEPPRESADWASSRFCGIATRTNGTVPLDAATRAQTDRVVRCFLDAVLTRGVVTLVQAYVDQAATPPSTFEVYRSRADGRFDWLQLSGQSGGGRFTCAGIIANELLNAFPPPDYDPLFFKVHGCADRESDRGGDLGAPPGWFLDRTVLPSCGTAPWHVDGSYLSPRRVSDGARDCIATALRTGQPMEFAYGVPDASDGPVARWFRATGPGSYEAIEAKPDGLGGLSWQRSTCPTPLIGDDGTPVMGDLAAAGCTPIDPAAMPAATTTTSAARPNDPRAALAGIWIASGPDASDATGPLPGADGLRLSFIPDEGGPLVLQAPCGTSVARDYAIADGRLTIGPWIAEPTDDCPSKAATDQTRRLKTLLGERPRVTITGDVLSLGGGFDFRRETVMGTDPIATAPTMEELRGRTFRALGGIGVDMEEATVAFGDQLTVVTRCSTTTMAATIVGGRLRTGAAQRTVTVGRSCADGPPLTTLAAWPRLALAGTTLTFALDDFATSAFEVGAAPSGVVPGSPEAWCSAGLEAGHQLVFAERTTVGDVRREVEGFGPATGQGGALFPGRGDDVAAYRCFSARGTTETQEYAVLLDGDRAGICTVAGVPAAPGQRPSTACA